MGWGGGVGCDVAATELEQPHSMKVSIAKSSPCAPSAPPTPPPEQDGFPFTPSPPLDERRTRSATFAGANAAVPDPTPLGSTHPCWRCGVPQLPLRQSARARTADVAVCCHHNKIRVMADIKPGWLICETAEKVA